MKMFKVLVTTAVVLSAATSFAAIKNTKHDLSATGGATTLRVAGEVQVCKFCHVPHNAKSAKLLWSRNASNQPTGLYDNAETMNATAASAVGATSLLCLSCHDGVAVVGTAALGTSTANLGTNLYNTHPVGINYEQAADGGLNAITAATPLFSGKVECASCHKVHDNTVAPFLRVTMTASQLCTTCHTK